MRNELTTPFWKNALQSLPPAVRERHVHDIEAAERWELRIGALIQAWANTRNAISRLFQSPRSAH